MPLRLGGRVARIHALLVSLWVGRNEWRCCLRAWSILVPREGRSLLPYKLVTLKVGIRRQMWLRRWQIDLDMRVCWA